MNLTKSGIKVGIALPQGFPGGRFDREYVRDYVSAADEIGYDDFWLTEGIMSHNFYMEPVTYLSYVAALTERIRLGVSVIILNTRNPVQLAKALACLDQMSNGRLTAGVGLGGRQNYAAFGISDERRVARFNEAIRIMRALWSDTVPDVPGDFWKLENAHMAPKPVQKPLPLWFGANSTPALRRAVRHGDGWMGAGSATSESFFEDIRQVQAFIKEEGKDETNFPLSKRVYIAVDEDEARARQRLTEALTFQYGNPEFAARLGLAATPERAIEVLQSFRDAGANHLCLQTCYGHMDQMRILTDKVVPYL